MPASRPKAVRLLDVARAAGVLRVAAAHVLNGAGMRACASANRPAAGLKPSLAS